MRRWREGQAARLAELRAARRDLVAIAGELRAGCDCPPGPASCPVCCNRRMRADSWNRSRAWSEPWPAVSIVITPLFRDDVIAGSGMSDDALGEYFEFLRLEGLSELTVRGRRGALDRLARQLAMPLLEATADDLLKWRKGMTVGPVSVRSYVSHVQQFYAWAARRGLLAASPAAGIPVPRQARRLPRPIGTADLFAAVAQAPDRIRLWLVLAAWCGLRAKEIALLRRECILLTASAAGLLVATDATKGDPRADDPAVPVRGHRDRGRAAAGGRLVLPAP